MAEETEGKKSGTAKQKPENATNPKVSHKPCNMLGFVFTQVFILQPMIFLVKAKTSA